MFKIINNPSDHRMCVKS